MINLWPVQQAIYAKLTAVPASFPIYDAVPQGAAFPYVAIGEISFAADEEISVQSADASIILHAWSRAGGKKETHELLSFVRARLDGQAIGAGAWACSEDLTDLLEDPSSTAASRLYHGIARYRIRAN